MKIDWQWIMLLAVMWLTYTVIVLMCMVNFFVLLELYHKESGFGVDYFKSNINWFAGIASILGAAGVWYFIHRNY
jgi:hypothetical protein